MTFVSTPPRFRDLMACVLALPVSLVPVSGLAAEETCTSKLDAINELLSAVSGDADDLWDTVQKEMASATSPGFSSDYFDNFEDLNDGVTEANDLVNEYYDLNGYMTELALGTVQDSLPPVATRTMENAVELAQAAADESSKLDLASLRCSQSIDGTALDLALTSIGGDASDNFVAARNSICKVVQVIADLQEKKEQLDEFRENGYPLFHLHVKKKKDFSGKERTVQFKVDLRIFPEYPDDAGVTFHVGDADQTFLLGQAEGMKMSYNTYFKWSDKDWTGINLYQYLVDDPQDMACVDLIKITNNAKASLCVGIKDFNKSKNTLKLETAAKFKYNDAKKTVDLVDATVKLPFDYLAQVSDMKEDAMQDLKKDLIDELTSLVTDQVDLDALSEAWSDDCSS